MPFCERPGLRIHYEISPSVASADAPWVLLVPGLSANTDTFPYVIEHLRRTHRVLCFDPRGAGRTTYASRRWELAEVADDAAAVCADLGIEQLDVLGISMGGMIAQEFAIAYPDRVRRLVLCCTWSGSPPGRRASLATIGRFAGALFTLATSRDPARFVDRISPVLFSPETPRDATLAFFRQRMSTTRPTVSGLLGQFAAVRRFSSHARLGTIAAPTLVLEGTHDVLVPTGNAANLLGAIPGAVGRSIPGGHVFFYESPEAFRAEVDSFLARD